MRSLLVVMLGLVLVSCGETKVETESVQNVQKEEVTVREQTGVKVECKGALKNIMHKGDLSANADLLDFENAENLYALGAVENLKGEVLILDGKPFVSSVKDGTIEISNAFEHKAALFVYATVADWQTVEVPSDITSCEKLEAFVEEAAQKAGINAEEPFPLLLEGTAASFAWHVIDWPEGDTEHTHKKHVNSGLNGTKENLEVDILGFYSKHHHSIFTHHTTNMHLHVKTKDEQLAGHVDDLTLGAGMVLSLPKLMN